MDNNAPGLSATAVGRQIGATAVEVNFLLKDQGFLYGEPGAYGLTPKGEKFGVQQVHDNGYGGYAFRSWPTTHFDPSITKVLDYSPDNLAKVCEDISAHKQALNAARRVALAEAEARFQTLQASKEAAEVEYVIDPRKVLLVIASITVVLSAGYGVYKGVQCYNRKKAEKAAQKEPDVGISV